VINHKPECGSDFGPEVIKPLIRIEQAVISIELSFTTRKGSVHYIAHNIKAGFINKAEERKGNQIPHHRPSVNLFDSVAGLNS
jgi:hypothetical protein